MNDHLPNRTLDDLTLDSTPLDVGSFDGFDPFAEEAQSVESPTAEATESNVTPLLQMEEAPLPSETVTPASPGLLPWRRQRGDHRSQNDL